MIAGGFLSILALGSGIGLMVMAGWFISASALVGLAGAGLNYFMPAVVIRALAMTRTLTRYAERLVTHEATFRGLASIRCWFFERAIRLAPARLYDYRGGDLLARVTADIDTLDGFYLRLLTPTVSAFVIGVLTVLFLALHSPALACIAAVCFSMAGIGVPVTAHRLGAGTGKKMVTISASLRTQCIDVIQGLAELKAYQAETGFLTSLSLLTDAQIASQRRMIRISGFSAAAMSLTANIAVLLTLTIGIVLVRDGVISGPLLAACGLCVMAVFEAVAPLPLAFQNLGLTKAAARRVLEIAETKFAVVDPSVEIARKPVGFSLAVRDLCFCYAGSGNPALSGISLDLAEGRRIVITGPSGSGKSTLFKLLLKFYQPDSGTIQLGGVDTRDMLTDDVVRYFGALSQRTQLFNASIRENLLIGCPNASEPLLQEAIHAAQLEPFIRRLPDGLDTWVGEYGVRVSGGEARRIALARVYLKDAPILLLDEPTEGLDGKTEQAVFDALEIVTRGKSVLQITHRQDALNRVQQVLCLENGTLVDHQTP